MLPAMRIGVMVAESLSSGNTVRKPRRGGGARLHVMRKLTAGCLSRGYWD